MEFKEIEHKFLVEESFAKEEFFAAVRKLKPAQETHLAVVDTYLVLADHEDLILRHRLDAEIEQLTIKKSDQGNEVRTEINLDLQKSDQGQLAGVLAFVKALGLKWNGSLEKKINVFYFDNCEIVYYVAKSDHRTSYCVEFEARKAKSIEAALAILKYYEDALAFSKIARCEKSLFELHFGS